MFCLLVKSSCPPAENVNYKTLITEKDNPLKWLLLWTGNKHE